jgi:hypothetical protein
MQSEMLIDTPKRSSLLFNLSNRTYTANAEGYRLVDITNGVFKNIFPFVDNTKCFYSFEGLMDQDGVPLWGGSRYSAAV